MTTDTALETLRALEARLRQLFADLGVPADEAVELRADELAAVLDVRVAASHEALRAKLAEVERERDEAVSRSERVSSFAATLIGNACERHSAEIAVMGFHEFQQVQPKSCHWCCEAERDRLAAEVDRLRATLAEAPPPAREEGQ